MNQTADRLRDLRAQASTVEADYENLRLSALPHLGTVKYDTLRDKADERYQEWLSLQREIQALKEREGADEPTCRRCGRQIGHQKMTPSIHVFSDGQHWACKEQYRNWECRTAYY